jgi:hypothetical protein
MKRECTNITHKHIIQWYLSYKEVTTVYVPCNWIIQVWSQKSASKDITEFCGSDSSLTSSAHPLPWKGVSSIRRPTPMSPSRESSPHQSGAPTDNPHRHRRKKEEHPHLHTDKNNKSKSLSDDAQQDLSVVTRGPRILDMQRLQRDMDSKLLAVIIEHF